MNKIRLKLLSALLPALLPALLLTSGISASPAAHATDGPLCSQWSAPEQTGTLDTSFLAEASGLAVSRNFPGRLYHHNDSGDGPYFYITDMKGAATRRITVEGFTPLDVEDTGLGPCSAGSAKTCLFLADIGDNLAVRPFVEIVVIEELENFPDTVKPLRKLRLRYPDGARNAEGFAVHPDGTWYILTKEMEHSSKTPLPARLYRHVPSEPSKDEARTGDASSASGEKLPNPTSEDLTPLEPMGQLDIPWLARESSIWGQIVTSFDISADGRRFIALTYDHAWEFSMDLSRDALKPARDMVEGRDFARVPLKALAQQEAIAYLGDGSLLYDSEHPKDTPAPALMSLSCTKGTNGTNGAAETRAEDADVR